VVSVHPAHRYLLVVSIVILGACDGGTDPSASSSSPGEPACYVAAKYGNWLMGATDRLIDGVVSGEKGEDDLDEISKGVEELADELQACAPHSGSKPNACVRAANSAMWLVTDVILASRESNDFIRRGIISSREYDLDDYARYYHECAGRRV
jgi:hypothetical protein